MNAWSELTYGLCFAAAEAEFHGIRRGFVKGAITISERFFGFSGSHPCP